MRLEREKHAGPVCRACRADHRIDEPLVGDVNTVEHADADDRLVEPKRAGDEVFDDLHDAAGRIDHDSTPQGRLQSLMPGL